YTIRRLGQVQLIFRAHLAGSAFAPGEESQAVALFDDADVPWDDLAFPSVSWALNQEREPGGPFQNPPDGDQSGPSGRIMRPR
ncbi:MAG: NUDIX hydrolase, partial [Pseudomonadota bacterium]